jgi:glycogen phosphorylase
MINSNSLFPYTINKKYKTPVAYFSMEFAIDQPLKTYSGGLGFLAGSHMRSAFTLKQNLIGIGMLWKYGYYDQERNTDGTLRVNYVEKRYSFLKDAGITFTVLVNGYNVLVKAFLLEASTFNTAPIFFLSTDLPENDYLAQTITHRLYDNNEHTRIAQSIVLGVGGAKLLDILNRKTEYYHLNEGHALPLCFYLLQKYQRLEDVKKRVVFTTHTPEKAGNEEHNSKLLDQLSFFQDLNSELKAPYLLEEKLNYTLTALRMASKANAVSKLHAVVSNKMWAGYNNICEIIPITNSQNRLFWMDADFKKAYKNKGAKAMEQRKLEMKRELFRVVANQTGKLFDPAVFTIVWARRFAAYKRANLILHDFQRFLKLVSNTSQPIQIIWAGKPYPEDHVAIEIFNDIIKKTRDLPNCAVLTGYEIELSGLLKRGSDAWLNTPRIYHEASGTSGMTAALNGSVNISIADGWIPEFAEHGKNAFIIDAVQNPPSQIEQDEKESDNLLTLLETEVLPMYYQHSASWNKVVKRAIDDVISYFDSDRMADEYYQKLYSTKAKAKLRSTNEKVLME